MRTHRWLFVAAATLGTGFCSTPLYAAGFQGLGDLDGGRFDSRAAALSVDGRVVVGTSLSDVAYEPFRWTREHGMQRLDNILTVITPGAAYDTSADGSVVVGLADFGHVNAFRWVSPGFQLIGNSSPSVANAVSADGDVVVGTDHFSPGGGPAPVTGSAFRWTQADGMLLLDDLPGGPDCSRATDVSADGRVIVGKGDCDASFQVEDMGQAVRWTREHGVEPLGFLRGDSRFQASEATAVSPDGAVVVGGSTSEQGFQAFAWTERRGLVGLGVLGDRQYSIAQDASDGGRFIVGDSGGDRAFLWTEHGGMIDLAELLAHRYGLDLKGWTLNSATAITPDGLAIAGVGTNPEGQTEAWLAQLLVLDEGGTDLDDLNNVRNQFGLTGWGLSGDMSPYDGVVDLHDLNFVRNHFGEIEIDAVGVPEPGSAALLAMGTALAIALLRRAS